MFDLSFGELMLIGVVALVVIGPERLPKVARTIGHLVGRAQRYVNDVKSDIQREVDLSELNNIKGQMEDAAKSVQQSVQETAGSLKDPLEEARQAIGSLPDVLKTDTTPAPAQADTISAAAPAAQTANTKPAATPTPSAGNEPAAASSSPQQPTDKAGSST